MKWLLLFFATMAIGVVVLRSCPKKPETTEPSPTPTQSANVIPNRGIQPLVPPTTDNRVQGNGPLSSGEPPKAPETNPTYPTATPSPTYPQPNYPQQGFPPNNYQPPGYQQPSYTEPGFDPGSIPPPPPPPGDGEFDGNIPPPAFEPPEFEPEAVPPYTED